MSFHKQMSDFHNINKIAQIPYTQTQAQLSKHQFDNLYADSPLDVVPSIEITCASDEDLSQSLDRPSLFDKRTSKKNSNSSGVSTVTALDVSCVLEDLCDQLDVLGRATGPEIELRSRRSIETDAHLYRPKLKSHHTDPFQRDSTKTLSLIPKTKSENGLASVASHEDRDSVFIERGQSPEVSYLLKQNYQTKLARYIRQSHHGPGITWTKRLSKAIRESNVDTTQEAGKTQADRGFLQVAAQALTLDLLQNSSCNSLVELVNAERRKEEATLQRVVKAEKDEQYIRQTNIKIKRVKQNKQHFKELQRLLWSVEDNKQEVLMRKKFENDYTTNTGKMMKQRIRKQCKDREKKIVTELINIKKEQDNEVRVHQSMMDFLNSKYKDMKELLDYWIRKAETDMDILQYDLDTLKENRERDLHRIAWLKHMIVNYLQICKDDRRLKAIRESRRVRTAVEIKSSVKMQAWWRGTMVRRKIGPFDPKKQEKKDKDNKKGKKKGKK